MNAIYIINQFAVVLVFCILLRKAGSSSELSTYAKQNCLITSPADAGYDCDITSNPLLFKQSNLPGSDDVVFISDASGLNMTIGKDVTFSGLIIDASDTYFLVEPGVALVLGGGGLSISGNSTLTVGGSVYVSSEAVLQTSARLDVVGAQSLASFGSGINTDSSSKITVFAGAEMQLNASSNILGTLDLSPNSAFTVNYGVVSFATPLKAMGTVKILGTLVVVMDYTQLNGILRLMEGTILSPNTIISAESSISGGGSVMGNLMINGTFDLVIDDDASFDAVAVQNTTYIGGNLTANFNPKTISHHRNAHTYTFLTARECVGRFLNSSGTWFTNATAKVVYAEGGGGGGGQDSVKLVVSSEIGRAHV